MRIFRAKKEIHVINNVPSMAYDIVFKGTMFFIDDTKELPGYDEKWDQVEFEAQYQELTLYNNFGHIKLTPL